ncbi:PREDICTED: bifunctional transcriptional activator/DNA repair enzyme Ada [Habropoda laboriosa]|uniref:bifunctional transcriptional activator/DNA repair enzyme Ada n=1 Tax=Habropoda laboriosa TaxID=597456 RepID=UPI00083CC74F|nr:PREDICTED: bifunctional transcriptional activator/DNA repair enzyme Ada [Habropoda laboriosa]
MVRFQTMTSEEYKAKHENFKIIYAFHPTPFGNCLIGITNIDKAVIHLTFVSKTNIEAFNELKDNWPLSELIEDTTNETDEIMEKIFSEPVLTNDSILVLLKGTEFQITVWKALTLILEGTTITYAEVASKIGKPKAVRAVGNAVMKNNIAYLVPCHRVVGKSSNKYKWGTKIKENILAHECKYANT